MASDLTIRFWGVRGSIPSPGKDTSRYGGNTACLSVHFDEKRYLILDAGTGIRELGKRLAGKKDEVLILMSHAHWDHIQGFPFFIPIYQPGRKVRTLISHVNENVIRMLLEQMDGAHFPVESQALPSEVTWITDGDLPALIGAGPIISRIPTNHPGGSIGFRIENGGRSMVYLTDNELDPPYPKVREFDDFVSFSRGADLLIHDAQYVEKDMPLKHGWGHSLVGQACDLAIAAQVKHLVLFHHDPDRTDDEIDVIQADARRRIALKDPFMRCTAAWDGLELAL